MHRPPRALAPPATADQWEDARALIGLRRVPHASPNWALQRGLSSRDNTLIDDTTASRANHAK